jgi:demethylmenaquinone methyltransferase/2-methoxy-6-polyprenyl-1,4-benzoquinol methylase
VADRAISKSPERIAGMFDAIAPRYDFLNHLLSAGIDRSWRKRAVEALSLTGTELVLDLCTGTGDLAVAAATARPSAARVVGIDFAGAMLHVAKDKLRRWPPPIPVALARGDATEIPVASHSVDCVTIAFGIRNVEGTRAACEEIRRVLAPRGRIAILEFAIPKLPVVHGMYLWYFNRVLPRIGRAISRDATAYTYLPASVGAFDTPEDFVNLLRQTGFTEVMAQPLTFGIVYLYTARS